MTVMRRRILVAVATSLALLLAVICVMLLTHRGRTDTAAPNTPVPQSYHAECPTAAVASAALGIQLPAPTQRIFGTGLVCSYLNVYANTVLRISFEPSLHGTIRGMHFVTKYLADANHVPLVEVPGLGQGAYVFTLDDAAITYTHIATSNLTVQAGSKIFTIVAQAPVEKAVAVAHVILGG